MENLTELISYAAGYFDGEGSIYLTRCGPELYLRVSIISGDLVSLNLMAKLFGGNPRVSQITTTNRIMYRWLVTSDKALLCLRRMRPFLLAKGPQAELVLSSGYVTQIWNYPNKAEQRQLRVELKKSLEAMRRPPAKTENIALKMRH